MKILRRIRLVLVITSLLSFLLILINLSKNETAYQWIILFPLLYLLISLLIMYNMRQGSHAGRITILIYLAVQWLRLVLYPAMGTMSGHFSNVDTLYTDEKSVYAAVVLTMYELIFTGLICSIIVKKTRRTANGNIIYKLSGNKNVYVLYVVFAIVLYILTARGTYTFLSLALTGARAKNTETNSVLVTLISYGLILATVMIVYYAYKCYYATGKTKYYWYAMIVSMLKIAIIPSGSESRLSIMYNVGAFLIILPKLFPEKTKQTIRSVIVLGFLVLGLMSVYKFYNAFLYTTYVEAIIKGTGRYGAYEYTSILDAYFYGAHNIAKNLYLSKQINFGIKSFLLDIFDNIWGLKYLLGYRNETTVALYNLHIYSGSSASGHLYSSISYGVVYLGYLLSPVTTVINILVSVYTENILERITNIDFMYILSTVYVRMVWSMFACYPMWFNYTVRTLLIGLIVVGGASLMKKRETRQMSFVMKEYSG